jgi:hypothetical protein
MTKQQHRRTISISLAAQVKMALHATKHGLSENQVHGIVLGRTVNSGGGDGGTSVAVSVTDVVPVCHEAPTKPIVDMALRGGGRRDRDAESVGVPDRVVRGRMRRKRRRR